MKYCKNDAKYAIKLNLIHIFTVNGYSEVVKTFFNAIDPKMNISLIPLIPRGFGGVVIAHLTYISDSLKMPYLINYY